MINFDTFVFTIINRGTTMKEKQKLIILGDILGKEDWVEAYLDHLNTYFAITFYDILDLSSAEKPFKNKKECHNYFITTGIQSAVHQLTRKENKIPCVLAFSMGGTIAWKAALAGLPIQYLLAISATRLRYETACPACTVQLIYGADDSYCPKADWFDQLAINKTRFIKGAGHELYKNPTYIEVICHRLISLVS